MIHYDLLYLITKFVGITLLHPFEFNNIRTASCSFGRVFAETLQDYAHTAGFTDHAQYIEMSGGASGAPDALWEDDGHRENIKAYLDTGEIDVLIMICCSVEFVETGAQSDEAIWNFTDYALDKNPDTRIGLSMLWKDFPGQYENASDYNNGSELLHDSWVRLASNLSGDYPGADIFTFNHGAVAYELWDMFEAGQLDDDLDQARPKQPLYLLMNRQQTNDDRYRNFDLASSTVEPR